MSTQTQKFPGSTIGIVHQNGEQLTEREQGVTVDLHFNDDGVPTCAEVSSDSGEHYAAIGLQFEGKTLSDYDGVFDLPKEVATMLRERGYKVEDAE